jgi:hypothetical protein
VHLVRCLLDEVFGSENFISLIAYDTTGGQTAEFLAASGDYLLLYVKERESAKFRVCSPRRWRASVQAPANGTISRVPMAGSTS